MQENKKSNKKDILIVLLLLITIVSVGITIWVSFFKKDVNEPNPPEDIVEELPDTGDEKLESEEGGGAVSLSFSNEVTIEKQSNVANLYFALPQKSNHDIALSIRMEDTVVAQSEIITPGKKITKLVLEENVADQLDSGAYKGYFEINYYNSETQEKATVDTQIPINIIVQ